MGEWGPIRVVEVDQGGMVHLGISAVMDGGVEGNESKLVGELRSFDRLVYAR